MDGMGFLVWVAAVAGVSGKIGRSGESRYLCVGCGSPLTVSDLAPVTPNGTAEASCPAHGMTLICLLSTKPGRECQNFCV
jgi:transposase-like protein